MSDLLPTTQVPAVLGPPSPAEWQTMEQMADRLARSSLVPKDLRGKPQDIIVIALTARELRLPVMTALNKVYVLDGKPSMSAELMVALILRDGHDVRVERMDSDAAIARFRRAEWPDPTEYAEIGYTIHDARAAGLMDLWWERWQDNGRGGKYKETWRLPLNLDDPSEVTSEMIESAPAWVKTQGVGQVKFKDSWYKHRPAMLWARTVSKMGRAQFADVLLGVSYVPEELGASVDPLTGEIVDDTAPQEVRDDFRSRAHALPEFFREQLKGWITENQCPAFGRLPAKWVDAVEAKLSELEQFADLAPEAITEGGTLTGTDAAGEECPTPASPAAAPERIDPAEVEVVDEVPEMSMEKASLVAAILKRDPDPPEREMLERYDTAELQKYLDDLAEPEPEPESPPAEPAAEPLPAPEQGSLVPDGDPMPATPPGRPEDCTSAEQMCEVFTAKLILEAAQRCGVEQGGGKHAMAEKILAARGS